MSSIHNDRVTNKLIISMIAILLILSVGVLEVLDCPEDLENTLQLFQHPSIDWSIASTALNKMPVYPGAYTLSKLSSVSKAGFFNEDYVLTWLIASRFRFRFTRLGNDASTSKYRSFYSLGNLTPRHIPLIKYRDFINSYIQQYGRSIH